MLPQDKQISTKQDFNRFIQTEFKQYGVKKTDLLIPIKEKSVLARHNYLLRKCE